MVLKGREVWLVPQPRPLPAVVGPRCDTLRVTGSSLLHSVGSEGGVTSCVAIVKIFGAPAGSALLPRCAGPMPWRRFSSASPAFLTLAARPCGNPRVAKELYRQPTKR